MDEFTYPQWTPAARERLRDAADALLVGMRRHPDHLVAMRGGAAEMGALFDENDALMATFAAYRDAVFELTGGGLPEMPYDDEEPELDEDERFD